MSRRGGKKVDQPAHPEPASTRPAARNPASLTRIALAAIIALHAALLIWAALRNSVAYDEYAHLPAGVAYLRYGEMSIYNQTPPLLRWLAAWPALLAGAVAPDPTPVMSQPLDVRYWAYGMAFLRDNAERYHTYFVLARLPLIALSCVGVWVVYRFARELYGDDPTAGVAAAALYALCPNLAGHASIVGTDAGAAVVMTAATWTWWRFCRAPSWRRAAVAATLVALSHLCKFYAVLLWPMALLIAAWYALVPAPLAWRAKAPRLLGGLAICAALTFVAVNVAYGFGGTFRPLSSYAFAGTTLRGVSAVLPGWTPVPLPANFVEGYDAAQAEVQTLFPGYLLGEMYRGARWNYYPVALACKLPLATIVILVAAVISAVAGAATRRHDPSVQAANDATAGRASWHDQVPILLSLLTFVAGFVLAANINLGIRYLLPAFPLAFVLAARLWTWPRARRVGWALLGVLLLENLTAAPRYLSFYNAAAGRGYPVVNDFDWGQSLIDLRDWMRDNELPAVALAYHGRVDPAVYGIRYVPLVQDSDLPYVAISGYFITGHPRPMALPGGGQTAFIAIPFNRELLARKPVATLGSILVYERGDLEAAQREWQASQR